jgi:carboxymethylenebutenolidase
MNSRDIQFRAPDGTCDAVLYGAGDGTPQPGVLFLTDIFGIRDSQRAKASAIAERGYAVLMPNIFYRTARPPLVEKAFVLDDAATTRIAAMRAALDAAAIARDTVAYVDELAANAAASDAPIGVVGYCFSGKMAMYAAAGRPERVGAAASFHGGHLVTDGPDSPHLLLSRIRARLYFGHADNDGSMPAEAIAALDDALDAWGGDYQSVLYAGAAHSWTEPDSPKYDAEQAARAYDALMDLLAG